MQPPAGNRLMKLEYKTVWISDTHLGSKGARAKDLSRFLK